VFKLCHEQGDLISLTPSPERMLGLRDSSQAGSRLARGTHPTGRMQTRQDAVAAREICTSLEVAGHAS